MTVKKSKTASAEELSKQMDGETTQAENETAPVANETAPVAITVEEMPLADVPLEVSVEKAAQLAALDAQEQASQEQAAAGESFSPDAEKAIGVRNGVELPTKPADTALWAVFEGLKLATLGRKIKNDDLKKVAKDTGFPIAMVKALLIRYMTYHGIVSWEEVPVVNLPAMGTPERKLVALLYKRHKLNQEINAAEIAYCNGLDDKVAGRKLNAIDQTFAGFYRYIDSVMPLDKDTNTEAYKLMLLQAGASDAVEITLANGFKTWSPIINE